MRIIKKIKRNVVNKYNIIILNTYFIININIKYYLILSFNQIKLNTKNIFKKY